VSVDTSIEESYLLDDPQSENAAASTAQGAGPLAVLRVVLVLALVATAIYGVTIFLKRIKTAPSQRDPFLKVLARTPVSAKTFAAGIGVGGKAYLVGVSDAAVSLIAEVTDKETVDAMFLDSSRLAENAAARPDFKALLGRLSGRQSTVSNADRSLKLQRERLAAL
jgi:flagellar protein FliO/FliZ